MQRGGGGGEGLGASLDPSQAGTASSVSWFLSQLLLLGVAALQLHLGTLSFMGKEVRGLQLTCPVFDASSAAFNVSEERKTHELFSEGNTLLCLPSLNIVPVLQIRAMEQWGTRTGPNGTMLVASSRDHSLMAAWSAGDTEGPQVFLPRGDFFHQLHSSLA